MKSRCLIAIDCSDQSLELVRYFSRLFPPEHHEAVLFHVNPTTPDALLDVGEDAEIASDMLPIRNWIATRHAYTNRNINTNGRSLLIKKSDPYWIAPLRC